MQSFRGVSTAAKELAGWGRHDIGPASERLSTGMQRSKIVRASVLSAAPGLDLGYRERALVSNGPSLGAFEPPGVPFTETGARHVR